MSQTYQTRDGDTLDEIAWRYYGAVNSSILRQVMDANPGIADIGPRLPLNVMVTLPEISVPATTRKGVVLWD